MINLQFIIYNLQLQKGQTLITLLFFMIVSVTITTAAVMVILVNALGTTIYQEGTTAYYAAESGIESALLRLLRDPSFTGESFVLDDTTVTTTVSGNNPITITSVAATNNVIRKIQVQATYTNTILNVLSWKEI